MTTRIPTIGMRDPLQAAVQKTLDTEVRPYIQAHGGDVEIIGIADGDVEVRMFAACGACELKDVTFAGRIRSALLRVEGVRSVRCGAVPLGDRHLDRIAEFFAS